ncbi:MULTISPECIES: hypothetical protein [Clostridium]|uniref:hypothetical protein n=1 Tax=Clostridium TaxID=1485 RepID=UPI0004DA2DD3|nr:MULTISPECIES: hypothetical protein [Clostridium]KEH86035.1 hypothetical protein Z967_07215 [Clostridium novyi A str. 4540]KEH92120.1 hypothetical protein Z963_06870 [Clostridium botulinum C/D str. It1]
MKKVISVLITLCISAVALVGCGNKENHKNKDLDIVKRKIEQNASNSGNSMSTGGGASTSIVTSNNSNSEAVKKLNDFENTIKQNNELLKSAYKDKIEAEKSSMELRLNEKLQLDLQKLKLGMDKSLKKDATLEDKNKKQIELKDKYKEELDKQRKLYEDKKNNLKKIFDDYDNKIKDAEGKRDSVIQAMNSEEKTSKENADVNSQNKEKEASVAEFKKYKDSINEVVKWRNGELKKIK